MELMIQNINKHRKLYFSLIFISEVMMTFSFPKQYSFSNFIMYLAGLYAFGFVDYLLFLTNWCNAALFSSFIFLIGFALRLLIEWGEVSMIEYLNFTNVAITIALYLITVSIGYAITFLIDKQNNKKRQKF